MIKKIFDKMFLLSQKSALTVEQKKIAEELKKIEKFPSYGDSEEDNAQEVEEFTGSVSIEKKLRVILQEIAIALEKIDKNNYGFCENCKGAIDRARLKILPAARICMECSGKK